MVTSEPTHPTTFGATPPDFVVCPVCKDRLARHERSLQCTLCRRTYEWLDGVLHLLAEPGMRFEDIPNEERDLLEERANAYSAEHYYLPFLRDVFGQHRVSASDHSFRVLFNGCGVGVDVDIANRAGFESYGVDCGNRTRIWRRRECGPRLYVGNARALPFADATFDVVITGCLFPHIGVVGDSTTLTADGRLHRQEAASEMVRVTRTGGHMIMANPNRWCPLDLWHQGQMKHPDDLFRLHSPRERFLLSLSDYRTLFASCRSIKTLPVSGYWGFLQKGTHPRKRYLVPVVDAYFAFLSSWAGAWLRPTAFNPWLIVMATK